MRCHPAQLNCPRHSLHIWAPNLKNGSRAKSSFVRSADLGVSEMLRQARRAASVTPRCRTGGRFQRSVWAGRIHGQTSNTLRRCSLNGCRPLERLAGSEDVARSLDANGLDGIVDLVASLNFGPLRQEGYLRRALRNHCRCAGQTRLPSSHLGLHMPNLIGSEAPLPEQQGTSAYLPQIDLQRPSDPPCWHFLRSGAKR